MNFSPIADRIANFAMAASAVPFAVAGLRLLLHVAERLF